MNVKHSSSREKQTFCHCRVCILSLTSEKRNPFVDQILNGLRRLEKRTFPQDVNPLPKMAPSRMNHVRSTGTSHDTVARIHGWKPVVLSLRRFSAEYGRDRFRFCSHRRWNTVSVSLRSVKFRVHPWPCSPPVFHAARNAGQRIDAGNKWSEPIPCFQAPRPSGNTLEVRPFGPKIDHSARQVIRFWGRPGELPTLFCSASSPRCLMRQLADQYTSE